MVVVVVVVVVVIMNGKRIIIDEDVRDLMKRINGADTQLTVCVETCVRMSQFTRLLLLLPNDYSMGGGAHAFRDGRMLLLSRSR